MITHVLDRTVGAVSDGLRPLRRVGLAILGAALLTLLAPAAQAQQGELRAVIERLEALEQGQAELRGDAVPRASATSGARAADPAAARLLERIDQLEAEISRLTGEIERLQYDYGRLNATVNQVARSSVTGAPAAPGVNPAFAPQPAAPAVQGAPQTLGAPNPQSAPTLTPSGVAEPAVTGAVETAQAAGTALGEAAQGTASAAGGAAAGAAAGAAQTLGTLSVPRTTGDPRADFAAARNLLLTGEFEAAEQSFREFVTAYPDTDFAGEAQYWIGESLYVRELYQQAAQAYLAAARDYPDGTRAADSLLKLAYSFNELGDSGKACQTLRELTRRYPDAAEPIQRGVSKARSDFEC